MAGTADYGIVHWDQEAEKVRIETKTGTFEVSVTHDEQGLRIINCSTIGTDIVVKPSASNHIEVRGRRDIEEDIYKKAKRLHENWKNNMQDRYSRGEPLSDDEIKLLKGLQARKEANE